MTRCCATRCRSPARSTASTNCLQPAVAGPLGSSYGRFQRARACCMTRVQNMPYRKSTASTATAVITLTLLRRTSSSTSRALIVRQRRTASGGHARPADSREPVSGCGVDGRAAIQTPLILTPRRLSALRWPWPNARTRRALIHIALRKPNRRHSSSRMAALRRSSKSSAAEAPAKFALTGWAGLPRHRRQHL